MMQLHVSSTNGDLWCDYQYSGKPEVSGMFRQLYESSLDECMKFVRKMELSDYDVVVFIDE